MEEAVTAVEELNPLETTIVEVQQTDYNPAVDSSNHM